MAMSADDVAAHRFIGPYTAVMHRLGCPVARTGVHPNVVTMFGLVFGASVAAAAGSRSGSIIAGCIAAVSVVLDGLDGAVAAIANRASRFGAVLDSVVDRAVDALWIVALVRAGGSTGWAIAAMASLGALEYIRARGFAVSGMVGPITVGERPTRAIAAIIGLIGCGLWPSTPAATGALVITAAAAAVGAVTLLAWTARAVRE
jgi:phosphatidylglycerophosphate synthase